MMAFVPPIPIGPSVLLHSIGLLKKRKEYAKSGTYRPKITAVIPAKNEMQNMPYALASLKRQSYQPEDVWVVDDGSTDLTYEVAKLCGDTLKLPINLVRKESGMGKTRALKPIVRSSPSDLIFVLDADTVLESPDYIEKLVEMHEDPTVASACGRVKPWKRKDRLERFEREISDLIDESYDELHKDDYYMVSQKTFEMMDPKNGSTLESLLKMPVIQYREGLYNFVQNFLNKSQQRLFGTTLVPVGCGVLYKRDRLSEIFDEYEKTLGDNLTNSEDIFIGFAICKNGYRNVQTSEVTMLTTEPKVTRLPKQYYLWTSSYLQSTYYFKEYMKSPFNFMLKKKTRPIGIVPTISVLEKLTFPAVIGVLAYYQGAETIPVAFGIEHGIYSAINGLSADRGEKIRTFTSSLASLPVRMALYVNDLMTFTKVCYDIARGDRNWRK